MVMFMVASVNRSYGINVTTVELTQLRHHSNMTPGAAQTVHGARYLYLVRLLPFHPQLGVGKSRNECPSLYERYRTFLPTYPLFLVPRSSSLNNLDHQH